MVNTMGWNERSDPDMRTANFCDVYREGVYKIQGAELDPDPRGGVGSRSEGRSRISSHCILIGRQVPSVSHRFAFKVSVERTVSS